MNEMNFAHQAQNFDPLLAGHVTVIGAGSVGSWVVHDLAKLGCSRITVYDFDHVESHNVPPSVYCTDDIGIYKVLALRKFVEERTDVLIDARCERYEVQKLTPGPVIACVDTMKARSAIWRRIVDDANVPALIDTRIDDDYVHVISVDPCDKADQDRYALLLPLDVDAKQATCGRHAVRHVTSMAAAFALGCVKAVWKGEVRSRECRMYAGNLRYVGGRIGDTYFDGDRAECAIETA